MQTNMNTHLYMLLQALGRGHLPNKHIELATPPSHIHALPTLRVVAEAEGSNKCDKLHNGRNLNGQFFGTSCCCINDTRDKICFPLAGVGAAAGACALM